MPTVIGWRKSACMTDLRFRMAVRGFILDDDDRVLLCRFSAPHPAVPDGAEGVWAAPGGGVEPHENPLEALSRELREETGLVLHDRPPHVWHQEVIGDSHGEDCDGVINDYFLVRAGQFEPLGTLPAASIQAEGSGLLLGRIPVRTPFGDAARPSHSDNTQPRGIRLSNV